MTRHERLCEHVARFTGESQLAGIATHSIHGWLLAAAMLGHRAPTDRWLCEALACVAADVDAYARGARVPFKAAALQLARDLALGEQAALDVINDAIATVFRDGRLAPS